MTFANEENWKSGDPVMDEEHRKLHLMIASMAAVIRDDRGLGAGTGAGVEAVDVLAERMRIHFRMEEQLAARRSPADAVIALKADHIRLLRLLEPVRTAVRTGNQEEGRARLDEFRAALDTHDRKIDIPLFRK